MQAIALPPVQRANRRRPTGPVLPAYALDGRALTWNSTSTAVMFDSTNEEYHSDSLAISSTALKALDRSSAHMQAKSSGSNEETKSRRIGTAVHASVLEPVRFASEYVEYAGKRTTRQWKQFKAAHSGRQILTASEWATVAACRERIVSAIAIETSDQSFTVGELIHHGACERVIYWLDEETGLTCKARIDLMCGTATLDIKTTDDARERAFGNQCADQGYDIQAAFYLRARRAMDPTIPRNLFFLIAVELTAPHEVVVWPLDEDLFVNEGERKVKAGLAVVKQCRTNMHWPGYPRPKRPLALPLHRRHGADDLRI